MNKIERKFNFKTLITFLMALMLTLTMVFATACGNSDSSSESSSESESTSESESKVDEQTLKNGDFEFHTAKSETAPNSPSSWTYTADGGDFKVSTSSTSVTKGIIDTAKFDKLDKKHKPVVDATAETIEYINPLTPATEDNPDTDADEAGTKVLMINNIDYSANFYTSQTTLSVPAGQYGKISVWVNTINLKNYAGSTAGAYVKVKTNVVKEESTSYNPLTIKNINTNGEWVEYVIYLTPNNTKATTYTLVLGLGEGNKYDVANLVKGFAFFDNVVYTPLSKKDFDGADKTGATAVTTSNDSFDVDATALVANIVDWSLVEGNATALVLGGSGEYNVGANEGKAVGFGDFTVEEESVTNAVVMDFTNLKNALGSAYTYTSDALTLDGESYVRISFWAKIDAIAPQTKATISIWDVAKDKAVASFDNVSTVDYENEYTNDYARYTFYVANNFPTESFDYKLVLTFGPKADATDVDPFALPTGYAIFKDFEIESLTEDNYAIADTSTDTRAKKAVLTGSYESDYVPESDDEESTSNDTYLVNVSGVAKEKLENGSLVPAYEVSSINLNSVVAEGGETYIGVANSKYTTQYAPINDALATAKTFELGNNKDVQALAVYNVSGDNFVFGNQVTIPKHSVYVFSVKVYVHDTATAFVRLVDMKETNEQTKVVMAHGDYKMETTVSNADSVLYRNGFAVVTFIIATGNESFDVRLEFGATNGVALFDSITTGTSASYTSFDNVKVSYVEDVYSYEEIKATYNIYYYADEADVGDESLRLKDEDGNVRYEEGEENVVVAFGRVINSFNANGEAVYNTNNLIHYYRFDTDDLYIIEEVEDEEDEEESVESSTSSDGENLAWLQITSILVAVALLGALIAVIVRKAFADRLSKKNKTEKYYHHGYDKTKRYTKSSDVAVPDADDIAEDYDYGDDEDSSKED